MGFAQASRAPPSIEKERTTNLRKHVENQGFPENGYYIIYIIVYIIMPSVIAGPHFHPAIPA
jgi:hypothetical protein